MQNAVLDATNRNVGDNRLEQTTKEVEIRTTDLLGQVTLIEYENLESYTAVRLRVADKYKQKRLLFKVEQAKFKDIAPLYDVRIMNCRTTYNQAPKENWSDTIPYAVVELKKEVLDYLKGALFSNKMYAIRFQRLVFFFTAVEMTAKYANKVPYILDTLGDETVGGVKLIDPSDLGPHDFTKGISKITNAYTRLNIQQRVKTLYTEASATPQDLIDTGREEMSTELRDSVDDYAMDTLPILGLNFHFIRIALRLFHLQTYHPMLLLLNSNKL